MFFAGILLTITILSLSYADYLRRRKYKPPKGKSKIIITFQHMCLPGFDGKTGLRLPPGPPGKPFFGNFFEYDQVPRPSLMREWKKKYGDIVSINAFGKPTIFVYSGDIARELFDKRGASYSDRPRFHMAKLLGWYYNVSLIEYGDWWRRHIRSMHQSFNSQAVSVFEPIKTKACRELLRNLLETPENFSEHIKFSTGRVIVDAVYAIDLVPENDFFINIVHTALEGISFALIPGLWLVDIFPMLKCIPDWTPVPFKSFPKKYRKATAAAAEIPFNIVKSRESPDHSFVSTSLERLTLLEEPSPDEEAVIRNVAGTAYAAGSGTSYAAMLQVVVASVLYPETQEKMQEELDRVLGDRLPTLEDRKDLPYVNAFLNEVSRWRPPAPLGVPHAVLEDDVYGDYFIPKGTTIIADSWQILRDEKYGPNPEKFNPERYFQPGVPMPSEQWGFGRRICPGRFFAENTLFLFAASILKVFHITHMKDENGNDIPVSDQIIESSLPLPEPFQCSFKLRSPFSKELIDGDD